jgi:hypothetical protein
MAISGVATHGVGGLQLFNYTLDPMPYGPRLRRSAFGWFNPGLGGVALREIKTNHGTVLWGRDLVEMIRIWIFNQFVERQGSYGKGYPRTP